MAVISIKAVRIGMLTAALTIAPQKGAFNVHKDTLTRRKILGAVRAVADNDNGRGRHGGAHPPGDGKAL